MNIANIANIVRSGMRTAALLGACVAAAGAAAQAPAPVRIEKPFFGLHVLRPLQNSNWRDSGAGAFRFHDLNVAWRDLEEERGVWNWKRLDALVQVVRDSSMDSLMVLQTTPAWAAAAPGQPGAYGPGAASLPRDPASWDDYVDQVSKRYRGKIAFYEIWNEPNIPKFFSGTPEEMAALTVRAAAIVRRNDPAAKVVCSGITGDYGVPWLNKYLAAGAAKACDVIGYHLYTAHRKPEVMQALVAKLRAAMASNNVAGKPLWNTESGWLVQHGQAVDTMTAGFDQNTRVLTADLAAAYVVRSHLIARKLGVERFYWYTWDHPAMGLTESRGALWGQPGRVYARLTGLLTGATLESCEGVNGVWSCVVRTATARDTYLWHEDSAGSARAAAAGELLQFDAQGGLNVTARVAAGQSVAVSQFPVVLRSPIR